MKGLMALIGALMCFLTGGFCLGVVASDLYVRSRPLTDCVIIPGEKGYAGAGDAGDGMFCRNAVLIAPGHAAKPAPTPFSYRWDGVLEQ